MFVFLNPYLRKILNAGGDNMKWNNTLRIDAVFGNDATGQFENISKPFQTYAAALASLPTSGDLNFTIYVTNGSYNESFDFDLYLNTSAATFSIYYEVGTQQLGNNTNSIFKCSSASKVIRLYVYNANISQTFAKKIYQNLNSSNLINFIDSTISNTGGSSLMDQSNNMRFENCNITSTGNFFAGGANGNFTIKDCIMNFTTGGLGNVVGNFYIVNSTIISLNYTAIIRGVTAQNCTFKSSTTECFYIGVANPIYLYNCTFVTFGAKCPIKTAGLSPLGAANGCSGITPTLSDLPTGITDNYFQNTQNSY